MNEERIVDVLLILIFLLDIVSARKVLEGEGGGDEVRFWIPTSRGMSRLDVFTYLGCGLDYAYYWMMVDDLVCKLVFMHCVL